MKFLLKLSILFTALTSFNIEAFAINYTDQAFAHSNKKRWNDAITAAKKASDPVVLKIIQSMKFLDADYSGNSFEEITNFLTNNPGWPQTRKITEIVKNQEEIVKVGKEINEKILIPLRKQLVEGEFDSMERNGEFDEGDTQLEKVEASDFSSLKSNAPFSIIGTNLSSSNISTGKESDYSIPKMNEKPKINDPYQIGRAHV